MVSYNIVSMSVKDLDRLGFMTTNITPNILSMIAQAVGKKYMESIFWKHLEQAAIEHGIPKLSTPGQGVMSKGLSNRLLLIALGYESTAVDHVNWETVYALAREKNYRFYEFLNMWFDMDNMEPFELEILDKLNTKQDAPDSTNQK